jgi:hypothetical protein
MIFPVVELLRKAYRKLFNWMVWVLWWNPVNRTMGLELYGSNMGMSNPAKGLSNELKWLKDHKVSKWVWIDYWSGILRGLVIILVVAVLIFERMATICGY